jgi:hypothetical protein
MGRDQVEGVLKLVGRDGFRCARGCPYSASPDSFSVKVR